MNKLSWARVILSWICATVCFSLAGILAYREHPLWGWFVFSGLVSILVTTVISKDE